MLTKLLTILVFTFSLPTIADTQRLLNRRVKIDRTTPGPDQYAFVDYYIPLDEGTHTSIIILQGAGIDKQQYSTLSQKLSKEGYLVGIAEFHSMLGQNYISQRVFDGVWSDIQMNDQTKHRHNGKVFVLGHSFGGVSATNIAKGICTFPVCNGPYKMNPSLIGAIVYGYRRTGGHHQFLVPILVAVGDQDSYQQTKSYYDHISSPKALLTLKGANHYGITNVNNPKGAKADPIHPSMSQDQSTSELSFWISRFIRAHSKGDYDGSLHQLATKDQVHLDIQL